MRTLKKTLCLVLCLAMVAGLCLISTSAAYVDAADIKYTEAVDVMSAIGVLQGDDRGFRPNDGLTRAEACKIVAFMLGADKMTAKSTFTDTQGHWAESNIAYCAAEGIVNGVGDGKFNPGGELTGSAFAKMLLCALGYNADVEGMTGAQWEIGVAKLVKSTNLAAGIVGFDGTAAITRDQAAQMGLNTLKATCVKYAQGGTYIKAGDVEITTGASAAEKVEEDTNPYRNNIVAGDTIQFGEKYFTKLVASGATADKQGRPSKGWTYDSKPVGAYAAAAPILTYTTTLTGGKLFTDLGAPISVPAVEAFYVDGVAQNATAIAALQAAIASGNTDRFGGNGTLIEVYKDVITSKLTVVVVNTYYDTIASHTDAVKNADGQITAKEYVTLTTASLDFETTDFTVADAKAATKVIYTKGIKDGNPCVVTCAAAKTETLTATNATARDFVAGGTTYKYSANVVGTFGPTEVTNKTAKVVAFDSYGYVIAVAGVTTIPEYVVVIATATESSLDGTTYTARLLQKDGTTMDVPTLTPATVGDICTYTMVGPKYKLAVAASEVPTTGTTGITKGTVAIELDGSAEKANANTIFFVKTINAVTHLPEYKAYIGIANVPSFNDADAIAYVSGTYVAAVYLDTAAAVVAPVASKQVIYVTNVGKVAHTDVDLGNYYTYNAVVDGTVTTLNIVDSYVVADGFYGGTVANAKGVVTSLAALTGTGIVVENGGATGTTAAADGIVAFATTELTYAENAPVYKVSAIGAITITSVAAIKDDLDDVVTYYTTNGVLTAAGIKTVG